MKEFRKPHKHGKCFYNHSNETHKVFFTDIFRMIFNRHQTPTEEGQSCWIENSPQPVACSLSPVITWIGHSSFLVQMGGFNILLDPVFGEIAPLFKRILPAGLTVEQLPRIDFVVISHNHRDHMDLKSLLAIKKRFPDVTIMLPEGNRAWFDRQQFACTYEQSWWTAQSFPTAHDAHTHFTITCLPAAHWSQRGLFDKNRSLWASWLLEFNGQSVYFAGDTCYAGHFQQIAHTFPSITIALMPIAPREPRRMMKDAHVDAHEAGQAFLDLGAQSMIPMHWGAFPFGVEPFDTAITLMQSWWVENQAQLNEKTLHCAKVGQAINFGHVHLISK